MSQERFFDDLSKAWWDVNGSFSPLHAMNRLRIPWICQTLNPDYAKEQFPLEKFSLLDIGAGGGILSVPLAKLGGNVTSLDSSPESLNALASYVNRNCRVLFDQNKIVCVNKTLNEYSNSNTNLNKFDAVVASEVIDHVEDVDDFIYCCGNVLKTNGYLFITTVNQTLFAYLTAKIAAEYILNIIPKGMHSYKLFITPKRLSSILLDNNFKIMHTDGLFINPFINKWYWTGRFDKMNYAILARKK